MSKNTEIVKFYTPLPSEETLPDCNFNFGHLENGKWVKKKCHCNLIVSLRLLASVMILALTGINNENN